MQKNSKVEIWSENSNPYLQVIKAINTRLNMGGFEEATVKLIDETNTREMLEAKMPANTRIDYPVTFIDDQYVKDPIITILQAIKETRL